MATSKLPSDAAPRKRGWPRKIVEIVSSAPATATAESPDSLPVEPVEEAGAHVTDKPAPVKTVETPAVAKSAVTTAPENRSVVSPPVVATPASAPVAAPVPRSVPVPVPQESASPAFTKGLPMATTFASRRFAASPEGIQSMFADMQTRTKASVEKSSKLVEEMSAFAKGNVEAMMTSGRIAAKGAETLGQEAVEYGKKSFEGAAAAFKGMVAAKSPTELFKLQSDYARASFDAAVTEGSKLSEAWLKLVGEIAQPLSSRVAIAADKIKAPVA